MKFNFKKISAIGSSLLLAGMSVAAPIAAANYPAPFVVGGSADVSAIVYGANAAILDGALAGNINEDLKSYVTSTSTATSTTATGDYVVLAKSSDNLNLGNTWTVFTGSVTDDDLSTLLADGVYSADDNDEFKYEQKITLGRPELKHFRDSDYETLIKADVKTPVVGFKLTSNGFVMNYTIDFLSDAESTVTGTSSGGDLTDIEGSDIPLMGKTYYVSDAKNGTGTSVTGKWTLLDSAVTATVSEGETVTVESGGNNYEVSISYIDSNEVRFLVNGETAPKSGKLLAGGSYKLEDGAYIGARDISKLEVSGELGEASFSIGSGKLEMTSGSNIKLNDVTIQGIRGWVYKNTGTGTTKIDKIDIEWRVEDESFLTPGTEMEMPGFGAVKFSVGELIRSEEEKITIDKTDDQKMEISVPLKDGTVTIGLLYGEATSGNFTGIGVSATEKLRTTNESLLTYTRRDSNGNDFDKYFIATYNVTGEAESYLLKASNTQDTDAGKNYTTISKKTPAGWVDVCEDKSNGDTCNIGDVSLVIGTVRYTAGATEDINFTAGTDVIFNGLFTDGGLYIQMPYETTNGTLTPRGGINWSIAENSNDNDGNNEDKFYLWFYSEDKDDNLLAGTLFNMTIDDTANQRFEVSKVNGVGTGGPNGLENEAIKDAAYEYYVNDSTGARIVHYTKGDEDYAEIYYPTGDSETYVEVVLTESNSVVSAGTAGKTASSLGYVVVSDAEVASVASKNLIIVGGTCINSATAKVLGVAAGTCSSAFTDATSVGAGQFLIQSVDGAYTTGKIALVVAGYEVAETQMATTYLTTQKPDLAAGNKYIGTSSQSATLQVESTE